MLTTAGSLSHLEAVNADGTAHIHIPITVAGPPVITQVVPSIAVPPTVSVSESISGLVETEPYSAVTLSHAANYSAPTGNELSTAAADDQTVDSSDTESDSEFDMADINRPHLAEWRIQTTSNSYNNKNSIIVSYTFSII